MNDTTLNELRKVLQSSFAFTFNGGRNQIRNLLIDKNFAFISHRIDYNGNSAEFASNLIAELSKQSKIDLMVEILQIAIANEDNSIIKETLISFVALI